MPITMTYGVFLLNKDQTQSIHPIPSSLLTVRDLSRLPNAVFTRLSEGGLNDQNQSAAGAEAGLDVQVAFGLTYPIKVRISRLKFGSHSE